MSEIDEVITEVEKYVDASRGKWNNTINSLRNGLYDEVHKMIDLEAEVISQIQIASEEITSISLKIAKNSSKIKKMEKERFEFYCIQYKIKTNATEKFRLMEADLSSHMHKINIFEIYVEFLRESKKNLDNIKWSIKNKIELYKQLQIT